MHMYMYSMYMYMLHVPRVPTKEPYPRSKTRIGILNGKSIQLTKRSH